MSKRHIVILVVMLVTLPVLYYLISPIWRVKELDENLPGQSGPVIKDNLFNMDEKTTADFNKAMLEMAPKAMMMNQGMPNADFKLLSAGPMVARAHNVSGDAVLVEAAGKKILRFENLDTINGPGLHIYQAADLSDNDYVDLGPIRATRGNVNYDVPAGTDTNKYRYALIWCQPFKVLFSYAELK